MLNKSELEKLSDLDTGPNHLFLVLIQPLNIFAWERTHKHIFGVFRLTFWLSLFPQLTLISVFQSLEMQNDGYHITTHCFMPFCTQVDKKSPPMFPHCLCLLSLFYPLLLGSAFLFAFSLHLSLKRFSDTERRISSFYIQLYTTTIQHLSTAFPICGLLWTLTSSLHPQVTLQYLWEKEYQVLVFYHHPMALEVPFLWPGQMMPSPWANTTDPEKLVQFLQASVTDRRSASAFISPMSEVKEDNISVL